MQNKLQSTSSPKQILLLCIFLTPIINIALDIYTPSLPAIAKDFNATNHAVNLTLLIYTATFGIIQPIIGPICDRFGRQPFVWIALITFLLSSIGASLSPSLTWLYFFRFGQGIGAAIIAACIKAILVDCFEGKALARANSFFSLGWSLTPIIAPAIGGYLQHYIGWRASFYFIACYCFVCILFSKKILRETLQKHDVNEPKIHFLTAWKKLLLDRKYMIYAFILTVEFSVIILYYLCAPYVLQIQLHLNAAQYGQVMLLLGCAYFLGNILNQFLLSYFELDTIILSGILLSILASIIMFLINNNHAINIYHATVPAFFLFLCDGLIFANILTIALTNYKKYSATAAAFLGGILNLLGTIISYISSHFFNIHQLTTLSIIYSLLLSMSLIGYLKSKRHLLDKENSNA